MEIEFARGPVPAPEGLHRPDDAPNLVISPGEVIERSDGTKLLQWWHVDGPWPFWCEQDGTHLYFGYTIEELEAIAAR